MSDRLVVIGSPSSAGAYAPGPEKAPAALRGAGLLEALSAGGSRLMTAEMFPGSAGGRIGRTRGP